MKKKLFALMILAAMALSLTACGGSDDVGDVEEYDNVKTESQGETADKSSGTESEDFSLLDISSDMINTALYAKNTEGGSEIVFSMFKAPDGTPMCSLFDIISDESGKVTSGDVFCGAYTAKTNVDEDGISWTELSFDDVYTNQNVTMGFAEAGGACYIASPSGNTYEATYLSADDAIKYMGVAATLVD